jgi:hypothetical protein
LDVELSKLSQRDRGGSRNARFNGHCDKMPDNAVAVPSPNSTAASKMRPLALKPIHSVLIAIGELG